MELFTLMGRIAVNNSGAISAIEDTSSRASALSSVFSKLGHAAIGVGKVMAAGLAAGAAGIAAIATTSVKNYAEYEQLVGGVETLFKDSSNAVMQYANNAYKTAGLSANEYMATVTSFSASLLQSLGGDTEAAAKTADLALTDMADNANKMGTSMEMIQNAYQGFAKQNYTMLDNLKLGYGGTKTEMQRLLKDAQKLSGVKYDIRNLNDVYEAIHVIQTEMGITGTTALEASETISGSWSSMSSAWTNLVVGIADDSQDLNRLIDNFAESAVAAFGNIAERIPSIVSGIGKLMEGIAPEIPGLIQDLLPVVIGGAVSLVEGLASGLPGLIQTLLPDVVDGAVALITSLAGVLPDLLQSLFDVLPDILNKLGQAISDIWTGTVWPAIKDFFLVTLGIDISPLEKTAKTLPEWWDKVSKPVLKNIKAFTEDVTNAFKNIYDWATGDGASLVAILGGVALGFAAINATILLMQNPLLVLIALGALVVANWEEVKASVDDTFKTVVGWLEKNLGEPAEKFRSNVIVPLVGWWQENVTPAINSAIDAVDKYFGIDLRAGWNSVTDAISDAWMSVVSSIQAAINKINEFFGVSGNGTIGGGNNEPWYVSENPGKYSLSSGNTSGGSIGGGSTGGGLTGGGLSQGAAATGSISGSISATPIRLNAKGAIFDTATFFATNKGLQGVGEAGAEAVTPISVLRQYVREEMEAVNGASAKQMQEMNANFRQFAEELPDMLVNAFASVKFDMNNREFARMVKAVT